MKVLLAMSGGVDSSVAGARLLEAGHTVVGVTMRLWGGESDTGCCSVADVDDARRVAQQLEIDHLVFNFGDDFDEHVVNPYVSAHVTGRTPNPCIECNRHVKFARLADRAAVLGFDAVATGHHARIGRTANGRYTLERGVDREKDQSYVVHMLGQRDLASTLFPVGEITKAEVRRIADPPRPADRRQARQPGRVLRHLDRRSRAVPRRTDPVPPRRRRRHRWTTGRHDRHARVGDDRSAAPARSAGRRAEALRGRCRSRRRDRDGRVGEGSRRHRSARDRRVVGRRGARG